MNVKEEKGLIGQSGSDAKSPFRKPLPLGKRSYSPPQLWEYGRLAGLTLQQQGGNPGDVVGGSWESL